MPQFNKDEIKNIAEEAIKILDDKKAFDLRMLDISEVSIMADYFIIASGNNKNQIQMLADEVDSKLSKLGMNLKQMEGYDQANWILLDFGDIIIHIFDKENRLFYDLERIWRDGKSIDLSELTK